MTALRGPRGLTWPGLTSALFGGLLAGCLCRSGCFLERRAHPKPGKGAQTAREGEPVGQPFNRLPFPVPPTGVGAGAGGEHV